MKTSRILFAALLVLLSGVVYGQDIEVTGSVLDASDGTAVPYASVHVKGTMRGVSADDQGRFSISAPGDGVLVFTCIGYNEKEVAVQGREGLIQQQDIGAGHEDSRQGHPLLLTAGKLMGIAVCQIYQIKTFQRRFYHIFSDF